MRQKDPGTHFSRKAVCNKAAEAYPITQERVNCRRKSVSAQPSKSIACNDKAFDFRAKLAVLFINQNPAWLRLDVVLQHKRSPV